MKGAIHNHHTTISVALQNEQIPLSVPPPVAAKADKGGVEIGPWCREKL
jgi:hypothetical protein